MASQPSTSIRPQSRAEDLFHLQILQLKIEAELCDLLDSISTPFAWEDFSYDYYDNSLELYGVPDTYKLIGKDAGKLREFGFHRVWMHKVLSKTEYTNTKPRKNQGERYYHL
jgi:hypothetical protein